jgi:hypothetical protein
MLRVGRKLVIHIQTDILHKVLGSKSSKLLLLWNPRTYKPLQNPVLNP